MITSLLLLKCDDKIDVKFAAAAVWACQLKSEDISTTGICSLTLPSY